MQPTGGFAAIESEIDAHLDDSRRHGRVSRVSIVAFAALGLVAALLVGRGLWPPPSLQDVGVIVDG